MVRRLRPVRPCVAMAMNGARSCSANVVDCLGGIASVQDGAGDAVRVGGVDSGCGVGSCVVGNGDAGFRFYDGDERRALAGVAYPMGRGRQNRLGGVGAVKTDQDGSGCGGWVSSGSFGPTSKTGAPTWRSTSSATLPRSRARPSRPWVAIQIIVSGVVVVSSRDGVWSEPIEHAWRFGEHCDWSGNSASSPLGLCHPTRNLTLPEPHDRQIVVPRHQLGPSPAARPPRNPTALSPPVSPWCVLPHSVNPSIVHLADLWEAPAITSGCSAGPDPARSRSTRAIRR